MECLVGYKNLEVKLQLKKKRVCVCYIVWIVNHVLRC